MSQPQAFARFLRGLADFVELARTIESLKTVQREMADVIGAMRTEIATLKSENKALEARLTTELSRHSQRVDEKLERRMSGIVIHSLRQSDAAPHAAYFDNHTQIRVLDHGEEK